MCKDNSVGLYEQPPAQVAPNGDLNNSLAVSEVAEQLADIGDKVELSYQQRRRRDEEAGIAMRAVFIALFIAFRVLIWKGQNSCRGSALRSVFQRPANWVVKKR